mgnify:CR=1 FL=1
MKILLVSPLPPPNGGIATWTQMYLENQMKFCNQVTLINSAIQGERINNLK